MSYLCPFLWSIDVHEDQEQAILNIGPWALDKLWVKDLLPSMEALHISPAIKRLGNLLPVAAAVGVHGLCELAILRFCPVAFDLLVGAAASARWHVLRFLIFGWTSLIQMRVQLLVSDQASLCLPILNVRYALWHLRLLRI